VQKEENMTENANLIERLGALPTANVGDAMERLGVVDAEIGPVWRGARVAGRAVTVEVAEGDNLGIHRTLPDIGPGDVLVVNGHGARNRALIGELIAERLRVRGCVGIVIDGAVRDAEELGELGFPTFARSVTPAGPYKNGPWRNHRAVALGGVVVVPGDIVLGDADGVVVVPAAEAEEVLARAEAKHADESQIRASIVAG
jgi:regulator of RNase E activity RraA